MSSNLGDRSRLLPEAAKKFALRRCRQHVEKFKKDGYPAIAAHYWGAKECLGEGVPVPEEWAGASWDDVAALGPSKEDMIRDQVREGDHLGPDSPAVDVASYVVGGQFNSGASVEDMIHEIMNVPPLNTTYTVNDWEEFCTPLVQHTSGAYVSKLPPGIDDADFEITFSADAEKERFAGTLWRGWLDKESDRELLKKLQSRGPPE